MKVDKYWDLSGNLRRHAKALSSQGACRDAISWWIAEVKPEGVVDVRLDWDHRDGEEPHDPRLIDSWMMGAGYPSTYGHHLHCALPCRICRGAQASGNSEGHVIGGGPLWISGGTPAPLREEYLLQVLSASVDLRGILGKLSYDSAVTAMEELSERTGMELAYCRECLVATEWNVDKAVTMYWEMKDRLPTQAWVWTLRGLA